MRITGLVPAAGRSTRMRGVDKLLLAVNGQPLLRRSVLRLLASGVDHVVVIIDAQFPLRYECLADLDVETVRIHAARPALSTSLKRGLKCVEEDIAGLLIHLPDMPDITTADINKVLAARSPDCLVRGASPEGEPGHPVLVPRCFFHLFATITGDQGLVQVMKKGNYPTRQVPLAGRHSHRDLDTPEDWQSWQKSQDVPV